MLLYTNISPPLCSLLEATGNRQSSNTTRVHVQAADTFLLYNFSMQEVQIYFPCSSIFTQVNNACNVMIENTLQCVIF